MSSAFAFLIGWLSCDASHSHKSSKLHTRQPKYINGNNTMTSAKVLNAIAILLGCIESQDWQTFEKLTLSNPKTFRALCKAIARCEEFHGMTLLHAVVRYDPPLTIVGKMIDICPDLPSAMDCLGRTPLHVAAGLGASSGLIKLLAASWPDACTAQDEDGKTPLHFACDTSCELFEDDSNNKSPSRAAPSHNSIRALLAVSLRPATMEDLDEMNPLEYAILSDACMKTVQLLQQAASLTLMEPRSRSNIPVNALSVSVRA
eukprot:scaffold20_cov147-Skeletonema_marinoi.AAC.3